MSAYAEKLKDPRWQRRRLEILERDDFSCQACGAEDKTLHVHHKWYVGEPWEAPDEALETLCEPCHTSGNTAWIAESKLLLQELERHKFQVTDLNNLACTLHEMEPCKNPDLLMDALVHVLRDEAVLLTVLQAALGWRNFRKLLQERGYGE